RLTEDLDVFVERSPKNAERLRRALELFGFASLAPPVVDLSTPDKIFMLGRKPWRIDVLTGISRASDQSVRLVRARGLRSKLRQHTGQIRFHAGLDTAQVVS